MLKRHYLAGALAFLSLVAGSAVASAAESGITATNNSLRPIAYAGQPYRYGPHRPFYGYRGLYDYAGPGAGYGFDPRYGNQWDIWSTGNGYY
jgi:hypothetical protein